MTASAKYWTKNCSVITETTVNYDDTRSGLLYITHVCTSFLLFPQGPDAPIHNLPKGAPPPNSQDNNLEPPAKANQQLLILMTNLCPLSLFVCKITCLLATQKSYLQKDANADQDKNERGGRKKRTYVPQKRSGGYAVLLALFRESQNPGSKGFMFKMELQAEAQQFCDKSFTVVSQISTQRGAQVWIWLTMEVCIVCLARSGQQVHGLVLCEYADSEESANKDSQSCKVNWKPHAKSRL